MKGLVGAAAAVFTVPIVGLAVLAGSGNQFGPGFLAACTTSGPVTGLDTAQARYARIIVAVAQQVTASAGQDAAAQDQAEQIALMAAATESGLHDYANPQVAASQSLPNDGPAPSGGDHDSVGLFQQRVSWGPLSIRMDPTGATRLFVTRLLAVPGWPTLPPGVAAQLVQHSAYPQRYVAMQTSADRWLTQIAQGDSSCGGDGLSPSAGTAVRPGAIPAGYRIPAIATDAERRALTFALAQLGKPYVFGAAGPDAYDCSGLTMAAWAYAGVRLPHYTVAQFGIGIPVAAESLLSPGDLIFIPGADGSRSPPNPQHVGIYLGEGYVEEAPEAGEVVKIVPLASFQPVIGIRRYG